MAVPQYKHPRWLALISFLVVASGTLAAQGNSGTITMTGHVVESACTFEADMGTSVVASGTALHVGVSVSTRVCHLDGHEFFIPSCFNQKRQTCRFEPI